MEKEEIQYNLPIKVLNPSIEWKIQNTLQTYRVFSDRSGNLDCTCFSKEEVPYIGGIIVIKTLKEEAVKTAYQVLQGIEGLIILPITTCPWERPGLKAEDFREEKYLPLY